ncbi:MAG TPA: DNA-binding protein [Verrucomicrobiae bacterium]|jgi:hypothetical protein|nr:DNA-binding protein [Verrucomicrobiae bacterium]
MRVFVETTIPSYITARPSREWLLAAHQKLTREWWNYHRHIHELYTSQLVVDEAACGDPRFAARRLNLLAEAALLGATEAAENFTEDIIHSRILPAEAAGDAAHIAIATAHKMDILLTWNCRHIANAGNQHSLRRLADARKMRLPVICTPEQLMEETNESTNP